MFLKDYPLKQEGRLPNEDFQRRLQRVGATARQSHPIARGAGSGRQGGAGKAGYLQIGAGGGIMALGLQMLKLANENYESIRESHGIVAVAAIGIVGMAIGLTGIVIIVRGCIKRVTASAFVSEYPAETTSPSRRPSKAAKAIFSLLGFALGVISCLYLAVAAAARFIDTEQGQVVFAGGSLIAIILAFVSLLFGFAGIFARGRGLIRVPVYFVFGWILTLATYRILRVNLLEWEPFTAHFQ